MLQELEVRSLTTNTAIISKRLNGDSAQWSIWEGGISRNVSSQIDGAKQRAPDWEGPKFWLTNIRKKSAAGLKVALSLKDKNVSGNQPHLKGGCSKAKSQKSDKAQRGKRRFRKMGIFLKVQLGIDSCLIPRFAIW